MYAVIGLGNPGKKYSYTRHNVGFDTIDCLSEIHGVSVSKIKHKSVYGETRIGSEKVLLVKPQTFMNLSGETVLDIYNYYDIPIENIIVVYDDIDLDIGSLRIRPKGSSGSHNGMRHIIYLLKDDNFPRVRIGVGKPDHGENLANFVLSRFSKEDREVIDDTILRAAKSVEEIIKNGVTSAMNKYNG